ncbi:hypothetical protein XA68_14495 [Ophiocordyceps unilateralis]|uniref:Uncharacterized protein n=1 Tax=Ophiocordyceps unilateralis TaxID=268505 RepID=A0A2A9PA98_OPHUN|nr:hypothetical protein XA68_14495 [Ophiocordyceps unilateralis]
MKPTSLLSIAALASAASAVRYERIVFSGQDNMVAGKRLFPGNVVAGYNADYGNYTSDTWAGYILDQCKTVYKEACDSTISFSAINSGTPKYRAWFGYVFRGGITTPADYVESEGVQDTVVYVVTDKGKE